MTEYKYWETEREQILIRLKRKLDILVPAPNVCKFHAVCKGYKKENSICQQEEAAKVDCGFYKLHEAAVVMGSMKKMLSGTDFGDFAE